MKKINSPNNPEIKNVIRLKKNRERKKQDLIIIEGRHEIYTAQNAGIEILNLYLCPDFSSNSAFYVEQKGLNTAELEKGVFKKISYRERPDGHLAVARTKEKELKNIRLGECPLVFLLESIEKPGNIGAILRTADAVRADAVILINSQTDIYNPNAIRASLGTVFSLDVCRSSLKNALDWLKMNELRIFSLTPSGAKVYYEADFRKSCAIAVGNEHRGLSKEWLKDGGSLIKIPMSGSIDSLNASVSLSLAAFEALRQRSFDFDKKV